MPAPAISWPNQRSIASNGSAQSIQAAPAHRPPSPGVRWSPTPPVQTKRVVQAMLGSSLDGPPNNPPNTRIAQGQTEFEGKSGEIIQIVDSDKRLSAQLNGREIGYLTYHFEVEDGVHLCSFGYILVQPAHQSKKLSSLLIAVLAVKALNRGVPLVRVVKPDPGLVGYWVRIGFDIDAAKRFFYVVFRRHLEEIPEPTEEELGGTIVFHADGPAGRLFRINELIALAYWR
jgi:GNAT superfamily N-acetyltransferase